MNYSGYGQRNYPRSILVILGGIPAWVGLVIGSLFIAPEYHVLSTMRDEPTEMTWDRLVREGVEGNTHVRLVDVQIAEPDPDRLFSAELFGQLDPNLPPEEIEQAFEEAAENIDVGTFFDAVLQPLKVYPSDREPEEVPMRVVVPIDGYSNQIAMRQIEETGSLTGCFMPGVGEDPALRLAKLLMSFGAKNSHADDEAEEANMDGDDENQVDDATPDTRFVFSHFDVVNRRAEVKKWFWFCGLCIIFGLTLCGSGGPSLPCCIFFQLPSLLSLLGYPMGYGRATKNTRIFYTFIGIGLIAFGYQKMFVDGNFGALDGNALLIALGYVSMFVGGAALTGCATSIVAEKLHISLEPESKPKNAPPPISISDACSLDPREADVAQLYIDPQFDISADIPPTECLDQIADGLTHIGMASRQHAVIRIGESERPCMLLLGCQSMIAFDLEQQGDEIKIRLTSVLHDGMPIVTVSANIAAGGVSRFGTNGRYLAAASNHPEDLVAPHLEQTVTMAEKRGTTVVVFEPEETADAALLGRRVLADVRSQYGEEPIEVADASYGRFQFPPQAIPDQVSV